MKSQDLEVVTTQLRCAGARRARWRVALVALMVGLVAGISLGSASGAAAISLSREWLAHSPFRASLSRAASRSFPGGAARSPFSPGARGRRSGILRDTAHPAIVGGGQISGRVTSAASSAAIEGIEVCAYEEEPPFAEGCEATNANGEYTLAGLAPGEYVVGFFVPFDSQLNYLTQFYDGKALESEAEPVILTAGGVVSGVDASLKAGARIAGRVVDGASKAIAGIEVCALEDLSGFRESCAKTNASGEYAIVGLATGEYVVEFSAPQGSGLNYVTQFYEDEPSFAEAELVSAAAGATTSGIDATLEVGGKITGQVTSAATKAAVGEIVVCAYEEVLELESCATTNSAGEYTILGLAAGSYEVEFTESFEGDRNYAPQYYDVEESAAEADLVEVLAEATTSKIDAALRAGGQITGTVTSFSNHMPLSGIEICVFPLTVPVFRCTTSNSSGEYDITSLSTGEYLVGFHSSTGEYATQYYDQQTSLGSAQEVSAEVGRVTAQIDAELKPGAPIDISLPTISGSAVEGQTLKAVHGSWSGSPTTYEDVWGICDSAGELSSCKVAGVGESFALTGADVGHTIRLRETAYDEAGEEVAYSAPTAVVVPAPPPQTGSSGSGSSPASDAGGGQGSSGVLGATTVGVSAAQLKALLLSLLAPSGKNAKIGALLGHGGYAVTFKALSAGGLTISWYLVPKGAHLATARPTLVARGHVSFAAAGTVKTTIKLTPAGKGLLKHSQGLKLTAEGSITPSGQAAIGATKAFALKR
jgi:hypothetical protein